MLVVPQFVIGTNALSPNDFSEGTFKTITLLFYLMTEKSSALLIEEPEVCVHHGLLSSIVRADQGVFEAEANHTFNTLRLRSRPN